MLINLMLRPLYLQIHGDRLRIAVTLYSRASSMSPQSPKVRKETWLFPNLLSKDRQGTK